jgi:predicted small lipoprotein YifL
MRGTLVAVAALACVAALATALPACGRKTPVRPPEAAAPQTISGLSASNSVAGVTLSWRRPTESADGALLFDLSDFVIERATPGGPFEFLVRVPVLDRNKLRQQKRFRYTDAAAEVGEDYRYQVRSVTVDGFVSPPSNVAELVRALPTVTPTPAATPTSTPYL